MDIEEAKKHYDHIFLFSEGLALVRKDGKHGFVNEQYEEIIPLIYDHAYSFSDGLALVRKDDRFGVINLTGTVVIPITHKKIAEIEEEDLLEAKKLRKLN